MVSHGAARGRTEHIRLVEGVVEVASAPKASSSGPRASAATALQTAEAPELEAGYAEPAPVAEPSKIEPAAKEAAEPTSADTAAQIAMARLRGYEGESCSECGNFTMVRNGTCLKCDTCGNTSGCS